MTTAEFAQPTEGLVRSMFWRAHPQLWRRYKHLWARGYHQNSLPPEVRTAFVDYVDYLEKSEQIPEDLASRITL